MSTRRDAARALLGGGLWAAMSHTAAAAQTAESPVGRAPGDSSARPRLGLALGGGSARGFAHIGVLKSLGQAGIKPDLVVGTSAGALVGAFHAAGFSAWQIEKVALAAREADIVDFAGSGRRGMLVGDLLARFVDNALKGARIEALPTRFGAVTTDLHTGELVLLQSGPVADAVRASCSIPGVFVPRQLGGRELVDGGLVAPLPVRSARAMGCDLVLAVDVGTRPHRESLSGVYEVLLQSFEIMGRALADQEARRADLVIRPDTVRHAGTDFEARRELIQIGYEAAERALSEIRKRLAPSPSRPRKG